MSTGDMLAQLPPFLAKIAALDPASATQPGAAAMLLAALNEAFPPGGTEVGALGRTLASGVADGSLCDRGEAHARFSRIAKPSPETCGLSVDVVALRGSALAHTHPRGEVTLGFPATDRADARFDGHPPGWVFMPPGSRHTPTVEGGTMLLLYFLPGGAITWHPPS